MRLSALSWWESLSPSDKPQTWNDMKLLMRETFVCSPSALNSYDKVHHLEEESLVIPLAMTNLLQDSEQTQEDKDCAKENEELTTSCANSEPSPHNSPSTPAENESKGNESIATLTDGETSLDVLNFSTNHASIEQLLVEPPLDLLLSQDDLIDFPCDKDNLCDSTFAIHVLKPHTCTEIKHVIHIASANDELKLISSLKNFGLH